VADTIKTESELLNTFSDNQAPGSITAQDMRDHIVSSKYLNGQGWEFHLDAEFTPPNPPRFIAAGARTQITIDGLAGNFGHPALEHEAGHVWDLDENAAYPRGLNSFSMGRAAFIGYSDSSQTNKFEFEVDVSPQPPGPPVPDFPVIFQETGVFAKGTDDQSFNFIIPLFVGADFLANGARGYITPESDAWFHTFALTIVQIYIARP